MTHPRRLALPLLFGLLALGCGEEAADTDEPAPIPELAVAEAAALFEAGDAIPVDANGAQTRSERGVVPGARLLTSSGSYDPAEELPADTSSHLVFYCGNTDCHASDGAANRARDAGYERVSVMRPGIAGWVEAGRPVEQPPT